MSSLIYKIKKNIKREANSQRVKLRTGLQEKAYQRERVGKIGHWDSSRGKWTLVETVVLRCFMYENLPVTVFKPWCLKTTTTKQMNCVLV